MAPLFNSQLEPDNISDGTPPLVAFIAYKVDFAFLIQSAITGFKKHCIMWWKLSGVSYPCTDQQPEINPYVSRNYELQYTILPKDSYGPRSSRIIGINSALYDHFGIQERVTFYFVSDNDEDCRDIDDVMVNWGLRGRKNVNILFFSFVFLKCEVLFSFDTFTL